MFTTVSAQLPTSTLLRLITHLQTRGADADVSQAMHTALAFWLDAQAARPAPAGRAGGGHDADYVDNADHADNVDDVDDGDPAAMAGMRGYQWKSLFLPEGTVLRSWSYGEHNYACVEGDHIMHEGRRISPNRFARQFARTTRNAWFDLSVRRPGDKQFTMANVLRKALARERLQSERQALLPSSSTPAVTAANTAANTAVNTAANTAAITPVTTQAVAPAPSSAAVSTPASPLALSPTAAAPSVRTETVSRSDFDPGWDLPERRQFRYRREDIAY